MTAFHSSAVSVTPKALSKHEHNFQIAFVVFSGLAVLAGTIAIIGTGGVVGLWLRNPVMWCVTVTLCAGVRRLRLPSPWVLAIMFAALVLSILVGPNQTGVHRWLAVGSVQLNVAALVMPFAILLLDRGIRVNGQPGYAVAALGIAATLAWQPDISQLIALIAAAVMWAVAQRSFMSLSLIIPVALVTLLICAGRPDPLDSVPHVEGIFHLAAEISPILAFFGGTGLLLTSLSPLFLANDVNKRPAAAGLATYFLVSGFACLYGVFPVPLAGYGISFILGWLFGATALVMK